MKISAKVVKVRGMNAGGALFSVSFQIGLETATNYVPVMTIHDCIVREGKDGQPWLSYPSKPRLRQGEHQVDDEGRKIYDDLITPVFEQTGTKWAATKTSLAWKDYLTKLALEAWEADGVEAAGRGAVRTAPARPVRAGESMRAPRQPLVPGTPTRRGAAAAAVPVAFEDEGPVDDGDDDLPF